MDFHLHIANTWLTLAHSWSVIYISDTVSHLQDTPSLIYFGGQQSTVAFCSGRVSLLIQGLSIAIDRTLCSSSNACRYYLGYHNANQICWGLGIGTTLGVSLYFALSIIPTCYPDSIFGKVKKTILNSPVSIFLQIRDGWSVWADGGRSEEWQRWRREWEQLETESKVKRSWEIDCRLGRSRMY